MSKARSPDLTKFYDNVWDTISTEVLLCFIGYWAGDPYITFVTV